MADERDKAAPPLGAEQELSLDISRAADSIWCSRRCARFAEQVGFRDAALWEISIAVSELVTNVLKFAGRGVVTIRAVAEPSPGIEVVVEDEGPGIQDIEQVVKDGYSEGRLLSQDQRRDRRRGLGAGLGAVHRLMHGVEIANKPDRGVRVVARKWIAQDKKR